MEISRATIADREALMGLLSQVLEVHAKGRPDIFKSGTTKFSAKELEELIQNDATPIFVARDGNKVLGHLFCEIEDFSENKNMVSHKTLHIEDLCVDENARGQHVGQRLYEFALAYAKEIGCYNVTLNVWDCNPGALAFYKKQGLSVQKTVLEQIL